MVNTRALYRKPIEGCADMIGHETGVSGGLTVSRVDIEVEVEVEVVGFNPREAFLQIDRPKARERASFI